MVKRKKKNSKQNDDDDTARPESEGERTMGPCDAAGLASIPFSGPGRPSVVMRAAEVNGGSRKRRTEERRQLCDAISGSICYVMLSLVLELSQ